MSKMISLRVPEDVLERVDKAAKANGVSRTRQLLDPYWAPGSGAGDHPQGVPEKAHPATGVGSTVDRTDPCAHPRSAEVKTGYMVMCGLCRTKLR
jgi:hypothetical protein